MSVRVHKLELAGKFINLRNDIGTLFRIFRMISWRGWGE